MSVGRMIAVVGPSGVGKDSVMAGIATAVPGIRLVRRTITRAAGLGGEDYHPVSVEQFQRLVAQGGFCVHWRAHGLSYGVPADVVTDLRCGVTCLVNLSRSALLQASEVIPEMLVLSLTASPETLASRLLARGREGAASIKARLDRPPPELPESLDVRTLSNDGDLDETIRRAISLVQPALSTP